MFLFHEIEVDCVAVPFSPCKQSYVFSFLQNVSVYTQYDMSLCCFFGSMIRLLFHENIARRVRKSSSMKRTIRPPLHAAEKTSEVRAPQTRAQLVSFAPLLGMTTKATGPLVSELRAAGSDSASFNSTRSPVRESRRPSEGQYSALSRPKIAEQVFIGECLTSFTS